MHRRVSVGEEQVASCRHRMQFLHPGQVAVVFPAMATHADPEEKKRFLSLVRQMRLDAGLRQEDLAERLGEPQSFVSRYESGERRLDVLELWHICRILEVPLAEFVRRLEGDGQ